MLKERERKNIAEDSLCKGWLHTSYHHEGDGKTHRTPLQNMVFNHREAVHMLLGGHKYLSFAGVRVTRINNFFINIILYFY
jgi:hypothetical protein